MRTSLTRSILLRFGPKSSRPRPAADNPVSLLAGNFFRRGRRPVPESPAMSWCCRYRNRLVAGRSGRGTGNFKRPEQGTNRRFRSGSGKEQAGENGARDRARPGCKARLDPFPRAWKATLAPGRRTGAARFVQKSSCSRAGSATAPPLCANRSGQPAQERTRRRKVRQKRSASSPIERPKSPRIERVGRGGWAMKLQLALDSLRSRTVAGSNRASDA
jgi:hypothetical protein